MRRRKTSVGRHQLNAFAQHGKRLATAGMLAAKTILNVAQPLQMQSGGTEEGTAPQNDLVRFAAT
jgi:hypothetical protein